MSRTSRIPHPPGTRYVPIYAWACMRFGLAGAAIIGLLEFLDRVEPLSGQPVASRARIIADLQGIAGRNAVDTALVNLEQAGAIARHVETEPGTNNIKRTVRYGLDLTGLARLLGTPGIGTSRNSLNRVSPELPEPGPKSGVPSYKDKEVEIEAAAPRAHARGTDSAAAPARKIFNRRQNGIVTWLPVDVQAAEALEQQYTPDDIAAAVSALGAINKQPVPGLVQQRIEQQQHEREKELAAAEAQEREQRHTKLKQTQRAAKTEAAESFLISLNAQSRAEIERQFREWLIAKNPRVLDVLARTGIIESPMVFPEFLLFFSTLHDPQPEEAAA